MGLGYKGPTFYFDNYSSYSITIEPIQDDFEAFTLEPRRGVIVRMGIFGRRTIYYEWSAPEGKVQIENDNLIGRVTFFDRDR
jgi:hypothetical protein